jgi:hypothetical protein
MQQLGLPVPAAPDAPWALGVAADPLGLSGHNGSDPS